MTKLTIPDTIKGRFEGLPVERPPRLTEEVARRGGEFVRTIGVSPVIDRTLPTAPPVQAGGKQGDILIRGVNSWNLFGHGTLGQVLTTQGAGKEPKWVSIA